MAEAGAPEGNFRGFLFMKKVFDFKNIEPWPGVSSEQWTDWKWQLRSALKSVSDFSSYFQLNQSEQKGFEGLKNSFRAQTTPYYASLSSQDDPNCPIRQMVVPTENELSSNYQEMLDPLGERKVSNRATARLIHRYADRALFLVTDICGIYCRYCTRKHFTASDQVLASKPQIEEAVEYLKKNPQIKEVIFSGGDPLTIGNNKLAEIIEAFYQVPSLELIRIGSRMPVVNPMRIDNELLQIFKEFKPIYLMTHFNHPDELTVQSAEALERCVDSGVPVFNQLVLLNGINNDPALIYALSRRLLSLRVKPYYMFQADPSIGTDHLRTSIDDSLAIQKALWGRASGLSMPNFVVDIPEGGGKAPMVPNYLIGRNDNRWSFEGWDGVKADYVSPPIHEIKKPRVSQKYTREWMI